METKTNSKMIILVSIFMIGTIINSGWHVLNQVIAETMEKLVKSDDSPVITAETEFVITQNDEDEITRLVEEYNNCVDSIQDPFLSYRLYGAFQECDAYKKLLQYDYKLVPYLIKQNQIENGSSVIVGSALADRHIANLEDLQNYQQQRSAKLSKDIKPIIKFSGMLLHQIVEKDNPELDWSSYHTRFSWMEWWENNKGRFEFKTNRPIIIDTQHKYYNHPHISTQNYDSLLDLEAVSATYRHIIERAAAELGVDVFIGEQENMGIISTVRMRAVNFEEFTYLIGQQISRKRFKYIKIGGKYHFGGKTKAEPRANLHGWGIMMDKTVFREGDEIPVTVITRGIGDLVNPGDPVFFGYGSFKITTNDGKVIKNYNIIQQLKPTKKPLYRSEDGTKIELVLNKHYKLLPGEYNIRFKYLSNETPSVAIEIY
jgi:hypothetical protein